MTNDELMALIDDSTNGLKHEHLFEKLLTNTRVLRAVVELHKPERGVIESWFKWLNGTKIIGCRLCEELYPCPTIQAIEKELSNG